MKAYGVITALFMLIALLSVSAVATEIPVTFEDIEINDIPVSENADVKLDILRDNEITVRVILTPQANLGTMELEAKISGNEHNTFEPIAAVSEIFDADNQTRYPFYLTLRIPQEIEEDNYALRIRLSGRNLPTLEKLYNLKIDVPRHDLKVEDVTFNPGLSVEAGRSLFTTVRVENHGEKKEEDVRVDVQIEDLSIMATDYIQRIKEGHNEEQETEEMFMTIPACAEPGVYPVKVTVTYNEGYSVAHETTEIVVTEGTRCRENAPAPAQQPQVVVVQPPVQQPVVPATTGTDTPAEGTGKGTAQTVLEIILFVLLGILVIVAIVVLVKKLGDNNKEEY